MEKLVRKIVETTGMSETMAISTMAVTSHLLQNRWREESHDSLDNFLVKPGSATEVVQHMSESIQRATEKIH